VCVFALGVDRGGGAGPSGVVHPDVAVRRVTVCRRVDGDAGVAQEPRVECESVGAAVEAVVRRGVHGALFDGVEVTHTFGGGGLGVVLGRPVNRGLIDNVAGFGVAA